MYNSEWFAEGSEQNEEQKDTDENKHFLNSSLIFPDMFGQLGRNHFRVVHQTKYAGLRKNQ